VRVSILLYDALDFSTDRDDGGGQTCESLSRIASTSAADAGLDPARFAHQVRRSRQVRELLVEVARRGGKLRADFRKRTECATLLARERYSDY
jgi:hypothetical protein